MTIQKLSIFAMSLMAISLIGYSNQLAIAENESVHIDYGVVEHTSAFPPYEIIGYGSSIDGIYIDRDGNLTNQANSKTIGVCNGWFHNPCNMSYSIDLGKSTTEKGKISVRNYDSENNPIYSGMPCTMSYEKVVDEQLVNGVWTSIDTTIIHQDLTTLDWYETISVKGDMDLRCTFPLLDNDPLRNYR